MNDTDQIAAEAAKKVLALNRNNPSNYYRQLETIIQSAIEKARAAHASEQQQWGVEKSNEGAVLIYDGNRKFIAILCAEQDDSEAIANRIVAAHNATLTK